MAWPAIIQAVAAVYGMYSTYKQQKQAKRALSEQTSALASLGFPEVGAKPDVAEPPLLGGLEGLFSKKTKSKSRKKYDTFGLPLIGG